MREVCANKYVNQGRSQGTKVKTKLEKKEVGTHFTFMFHVIRFTRDATRAHTVTQSKILSKLLPP